MPKKITTKEKDVSFTLEAIVNEAKRINENCLYTSKSHFVFAHFWTNFHLWFGIPTTVLAAIAGALAFADFNHHDTIAGLLAIAVTILTAVTTFLNPKERSGIHLSAGNNYDELLTKVRIFWTVDCRREESMDILTDKLKSFSEQRDRLNRDCPQPPKWTFKKARKGIESGEAEYAVDKQN